MIKSLKISIYLIILCFSLAYSMDSMESDKKIKTQLIKLHELARCNQNCLRALSLIYDNLHSHKEINDKNVLKILLGMGFTESIEILKLKENWTSYPNFSIPKEVKEELDNYQKKEVRLSENAELFLVENSLATHELGYFIREEVIRQLDGLLKNNVTRGRKTNEL